MVDCLSLSHYRALDMEDHTLPWNDTHTINLEHSYCYCGQDRNLLEIALQCRCKLSIDTNVGVEALTTPIDCRNWFHAECTSVSNPPDLLFTTNYVFVCHHCGDNHVESFERTTAGWKDICSTTIANLILEEILYRVGTEDRDLFESKNAALMFEWNPEQYYFNKKEIIPFVDKHWKSICTERARTTTWYVDYHMTFPHSSSLVYRIGGLHWEAVSIHPKIHSWPVMNVNDQQRPTFALQMPISGI